MDAKRGKTLFYKRSHFVTHLPVDAVYSPSHSWLLRDESGLCRVGFTKFATRMLGEMVDHKFEIAADTVLSVGKIIGWVEGFKAISDVYSIVDGSFHQSNPQLNESISLVSSKPYADGWLYEAKGEPDSRCLDVNAYAAVLDVTIDKILDEEKASENK